ncbi:MAG TPA: phosphogluconate dehydratase [Gammaproteobacteria bacterium]|uniref:phosphogluconate dehydratase n=3 Tax=Immundisolibacter sp. TaxID=1934948 RepID=UPI000E90561C|nr:phosphogluconate dehydratase [Gammaproteobacteria bacterium]HCZ48818.1 phosphogluconate dehydratase [Gammaproteobacteria bacterium]MCH78256.1 phosphogluconate dehydratase [Gammaproteobacteria bacterium]
MTIHPVVEAVTERIRRRSQPTRQAYLARITRARQAGPVRMRLPCANLAHACAASGPDDKRTLTGGRAVNIAIVSAYNDMLSAHQPLETYPAILKQTAADLGAVAQFAGGVPAMCDGVTQGEAGMDLSLFSRDTIALATGVALSHNAFDGMLLLGVCDKIVPGLLIGALAFGHLPAVFVPAGPMPSGLSNAEKAKIRQLHAEGKLDNAALLEAESRAYHAPGTCTFYGTANTNQMLMELMGLHVPGTAFVNPGTPLRDALTAEAARLVVGLARDEHQAPLGEVVDERAIVNATVGLLATGGSTNHALHVPAIAAAAGMLIDWDDLATLSAVVPLLARVYPNGSADVNHFQAAGGTGFVIRELLAGGLLHTDVRTVSHGGLADYTREPTLDAGRLDWQPAPAVSGDDTIVRPLAQPFSADGGLRVLNGNLGRAIVKVSAVKPEHRVIEAPARVFDSQEALHAAFRNGELERDLVAVVRFQGPRANGMPELHRLTPVLGVLQDRGFKVALVTDGRMSGASGKVPAAIHVTPECLNGGPLARVRDGDVLRLDAERSELMALVPEQDWAQRVPAMIDLDGARWGCGRDLFGFARQMAVGAEQGGGFIAAVPPPLVSLPTATEVTA